MTEAALRMDLLDLEAFLDERFPQARALGFTLDALDPAAGLTLGLLADAAHLRPGGTVSGPTLMTLADAAAYLLILAHRGPVALAVTTQLNMHFLRRPPPGPLRCHAQLLQLGRRLAVVEARLWSDAGAAPRLCAHATVSYALPADAP